MNTIRVNVRELIDIIGNPMEEDVWQCGTITELDVLSCPDSTLGRFPAGLTPHDSTSKEYNIARIAWLAENHDHTSTTDPEPITINRVPNHWPITDGNHRLAAAYVTGVEYITANITS